MTIFLYIFIPGQVNNLIVLKEAYLKKVFIEAKAIKQYHNELEKCSLAKAQRLIIKPKNLVFAKYTK